MLIHPFLMSKIKRNLDNNIDKNYNIEYSQISEGISQSNTCLKNARIVWKSK